MNFIRVFVFSFFFLSFFACNPTEQKEIKSKTTASDSIKSATFIYNVSEIVLTENTTSSKFIPVQDFDNAFYKILPALPNGLSLNTTTGEISGIPTETLTKTQYLVEAETLEGVEFAFINITVNPEPPKSFSYGLTTLVFDKGVAGSFTPLSTGGSISEYSITPELPNGLVLSATNGAIETFEITPGNIPTSPTSSFHTVTASNESGSISTTLLIVINDAPPIGLSYTPNTQDFVVGASASFSAMVPSLSAIDPAPVDLTYSVSPKLPDGLELLADGSIQGTPEESPGAGASNYTITASNSMGSSSTLITLNITEPSISLSYSPDTYTVEQNQSITPILRSTYVGGEAPGYSCFIDNNTDGINNAGDTSCPAWVSLDSVTGTISGTPPTIGTTILTIAAENIDNSSPLADTPANPPVDTVTINVTEDGPNDPNYIGYEELYILSENQTVNIVPKNPGGRPSEYNITNNLLASGDDGGGNNLSITAGTPSTANFGSALAAGVGVGNVISYDSNADTQIDTIALIIGEISTNQYEIINVDGSDVAALAATQEWFISGALPDGLGFVNGNIIGRVNLDKNGSESCTSSSGGDFIVDIEGRNLDETSTSQQTGTQSITLRLNAIAPTKLGYTENRSGAIFNGGVFKLSDGSPIPSADVIAPNGLAGGTPSRYSISPRLPAGLNLDDCTGVISGTPTEITPIRNYTITATNSAGNFSETIAISTNNLVAPTALIYNDGGNCSFDGAPENELIFTLFSNQSEAPCYVGSSASFSISPALPAGLSLNSLTGEISGLAISTDDSVTNYTITATNILGSISTTISLTVDNLALNAPDLSYMFNSSTLGTLTLTEGEVISEGELFINVANNTGIPTLFGVAAGGAAVNIAGTNLDILTTPVVAAPTAPASEAAAGTRNIVFNDTNGEISTYVFLDSTDNNNPTSKGVLATDPGELTPTPETITVAANNDVGTPATIAFDLLVNERPLNFSYPNNNTITFTPNELGTPDTTSGAADHIGGDVAIRTGGVASTNCSATLLSSSNTPPGSSSSDLDLINIAGTGLSLDTTTCSIEYDSSICASDVSTNVSAGPGAPYSSGNTILEYRVTAFNSGSPSGFSRNVRINYFDRPNFLFEPDSAFTQNKYAPSGSYVSQDGEFEVSKHLTLSTSNLSYTPDTSNRCHVGSFQLNLTADLPTPLSFSSANGEISNTGNSIIGRRNFDLISTESLSGQNFTQTEEISVQSNHVLDLSGDVNANRRFQVTKFDFNLDGNDDLILQNMECFSRDGDQNPDGANCGTNTVSTNIFIQNTSADGVFDSANSALPVLDNLRASAITPIRYSSTDTGVIYIRNTLTNIESRSATDLTAPTSSTSSLALTSPGYPMAIVPNRTTISNRVGVLIMVDNAGTQEFSIDQYEVDNNMVLSAAAPNANIALANTAGGGIDSNSIIRHTTVADINADGNNELFIAYQDNNDSRFKVCGITNDGSDFASTCTPRLVMPFTGATATTDILDIKFANVSGDNLEDLIVLVSNGVENQVSIYENRNSTLAGFFQLVDTLPLGSTNQNMKLDLADTNADGFNDIIVSNLESDINRDGVAEDGNNGTQAMLTGMTVYFNTNLPSDLFNETISDTFPAIFHYSQSGGNTNELEIINSGSSRAILHCQTDIDNGTTDILSDKGGGEPRTGSTEQNSSCGIVGSF